MNAERTEMEPEPRKPWFSWGCNGDLSERDRRNLRRYNAWVLTFGFLFVASVALLARSGVVEGTVMRWIVALVPDVVGVMAVRAYVRFLRDADELVRKIHLEATALGFGAGVVFILGYALAELAGAPRMDTPIPAAVMLLLAGLGQWLGMRRYR